MPIRTSSSHDIHCFKSITHHISYRDYIATTGAPAPRRRSTGDVIRTQRRRRNEVTRTEEKCAPILNVAVRKCPAVLELLPSEDQTLLGGGDALRLLNLRLDIVNSIRRVDLKRDGLDDPVQEHLDVDLHAAVQTEDRVQRRLLLDAVIRESGASFGLFPGEDLVRGNPS